MIRAALFNPAVDDLLQPVEKAPGLRLPKHDHVPEWHTGPAGSALISSASLSQSVSIVTTLR